MFSKKHLQYIKSAVNFKSRENSKNFKYKMADDTSANHTSNSTFDIYLRKLMLYVAKNPGEFVSYVFLILSPLMLICGYLSWKLIQMMEQEKKENKRKGVKNANMAKTRRKKNKAKPE